MCNIITAAKSAMKADNNASSLNSTGNNGNTNKLRSRYESGTAFNKSTANRSRVASGAKGLAQSKLTLIRSKPSASAGNSFSDASIT